MVKITKKDFTYNKRNKHSRKHLIKKTIKTIKSNKLLKNNNKKITRKQVGSGKYSVINNWKLHRDVKKYLQFKNAFTILKNEMYKNKDSYTVLFTTVDELVKKKMTVLSDYLRDKKQYIIFDQYHQYYRDLASSLNQKDKDKEKEYKRRKNIIESTLKTYSSQDKSLNKILKTKEKEFKILNEGSHNLLSSSKNGHLDHIDKLNKLNNKLSEVLPTITIIKSFLDDIGQIKKMKKDQIGSFDKKKLREYEFNKRFYDVIAKYDEKDIRDLIVFSEDISQKMEICRENIHKIKTDLDITKIDEKIQKGWSETIALLFKDIVYLNEFEKPEFKENIQLIYTLLEQTNITLNNNLKGFEQFKGRNPIIITFDNFTSYQNELMQVKEFFPVLKDQFLKFTFASNLILDFTSITLLLNSIRNGLDMYYTLLNYSLYPDRPLTDPTYMKIDDAIKESFKKLLKDIQTINPIDYNKCVTNITKIREKIEELISPGAIDLSGDKPIESVLLKLKDINDNLSRQKQNELELLNVNIQMKSDPALKFLQEPLNKEAHSIDGRAQKLSESFYEIVKNKQTLYKVFKADMQSKSSELNRDQIKNILYMAMISPGANSDDFRKIALNNDNFNTLITILNDGEYYKSVKTQQELVDFLNNLKTIYYGANGYSYSNADLDKIINDLNYLISKNKNKGGRGGFGGTGAPPAPAPTPSPSPSPSPSPLPPPSFGKPSP